MNPQHRINKLANRKRRLAKHLADNQTRRPALDEQKQAQERVNAILLARLNEIAKKLLTP